MTRKEEREHTAMEYTKKWYKDLGTSLEDYPTDAKITIDEFIKGAEWADETMIEKACNWLDRYFENKVFKTQKESIINDFKECMEE